MAISRRRTLALVAGVLAASSWRLAAGTPGDGRRYLSAGADAAGRFRVGGFSGSGGPVLDEALPARGHAFAVRPDGRLAVHFARRPGEFAFVLDFGGGGAVQLFFCPGDRRFQGHGVFDPSGRLIYATENDFEAGSGVVGVYDTRDRFRRLGELPSHGVGPHDIAMLPGGRTLVVANGGIATHPDYPRVKLNLPTMQSSLCFIDGKSGDLLQRLKLSRDLHRLGIRHIAVGEDGPVAVAMQYEGPKKDRVPLVALFRPGGSLRPLDTPAPVLRAMKQYCGDVCFDSEGRLFAVSAPRGNLATVWNGADGGFLFAVPLADCCGIAPGSRGGEFLVSSGQGGVFLLDSHKRRTRPFPTGFADARRWDNHLAVAVAGRL